MAEKELRGMNRTELIEIIYALQQEERSLREENERLRCQLEDKTLRMEKAGSIAEAALSLNHIFEDAEAAAQQYLDSIQAMNTAQTTNTATGLQTETTQTVASSPTTGVEDVMELIRQIERACQTEKERDVQQKRDPFGQEASRGQE